MAAPIGMQASLFQDGWQESARRLYRRVRGWNVPMAVLADEAGLLYVRHDNYRLRPGQELVGIYTNAVQINDIEDDLIEYLRDLTGRAVRKAA